MEGKIDYEQTKKMVVDILKTDDGKKAIQELMADDKYEGKISDGSKGCI